MSIFNQPYPIHHGLRRKLLFAFIFGLFVFLFLWVFQPFGINLWKPNYKTIRLIGYGIITMLVLIFNSLVVENLFQNWFKEENWKVWKEITWALWNILLIGTLNLLYSYWQTMFPLNWSSFLNFQWITLLIGIFPVVTITLINYTRLQNKNLHDAQQISHIIETDAKPATNVNQDALIVLMAENGKDKITMSGDNLLLLMASDNYVEVYFRLNGLIKKELLRNTIKNLEPIFMDDPRFFRCHRSYLVNLEKIKHVTGNSQGYKLHMEDLDILVPVSRSLNSQIRQKISNIHPIHPS